MGEEMRGRDGGRGDAKRPKGECVMEKVGGYPRAGGVSIFECF